jgi:hypothetical protein
MGRLMEVFRPQEQSDVEKDAAAAFRSLAVAQSVAGGSEQNTSVVVPRFGCGVERLQAQCPADVAIQLWRRAVQDAVAFVLRWEHQAALLGWTYDDVFGATNIRRLPLRSSPDGLIWVLDGRPGLALTENAAVSRSSSGRLLLFSRYRQPFHSGSWL